MSVTDGMNVDMDIQADSSIPSQSNSLVGYPPPEAPGQGVSGGGKPQRFVEQGIPENVLHGLGHEKKQAAMEPEIPGGPSGPVPGPAPPRFATIMPNGATFLQATPDTPDVVFAGNFTSSLPGGRGTRGETAQQSQEGYVGNISEG